MKISPIALTLSLLTTVLGLCYGCNMAGLALAFRPPEKVSALYKIPEGKKVLVFVDDPNGMVKYEKLKYDLATNLNSELIKNKVAVDTIPYDQVTNLMIANPSTFNKMRISEVGQQLGADLVIYVMIEDCSITEEGPATESWNAKLAAAVRVVDIQGKRLWPRDNERGYDADPINMNNQHGSGNYSQQLAKTMAMQMSDGIAKMFYDWEKPFEQVMGEGIKGGDFPNK